MGGIKSLFKGPELPEPEPPPPPVEEDTNAQGRARTDARRRALRARGLLGTVFTGDAATGLVNQGGAGAGRRPSGGGLIGS